MSSDHVCTCPSIDRQTLCQRSCSEREFGTCHFANIYNHHAMENGYQVNIIVQTKSLQQQQQQKAAAVRSLISTQEMSSFSSSTPLSLAYNHTHTLRERDFLNDYCVSCHTIALDRFQLVQIIVLLWLLLHTQIQKLECDICVCDPQ